MNRNMRNVDVAEDESYLRDEDVDESLWTSPVKGQASTMEASKDPKSSTSKTPAAGKVSYLEQQARDETLRKELTAVRKVNESIEGLIESLQKAKSNVKVVNRTVGATSTLLNAWTRILSQTEHNQRLILDPAWQGASQDIADLEDEAISKQQAAERRDAEESERKQAAARRAEEEERRKSEPEANATRPGTRGRIRSGTRASSRARTGYVAAGSVSTDTSMSSIARGRDGNRRGIGRGIAGRGARGRG